MLRVAGVGKIICDNLKEEFVDKELVVKTLLLHDMGNIIKFDFDRIELLDVSDLKRVGELKRIQSDFINKYGPHTDKATLYIINEITRDNRIIDLCANSHGQNLHQFLDSNEWDKKICFYSDMRVGPKSIVSINERFKDLMIRNPQDEGKMITYQKQSLNLEKLLQRQVFINVKQISDATVNKEITTLRKSSI